MSEVFDSAGRKVESSYVGEFGWKDGVPPGYEEEAALLDAALPPSGEFIAIAGVGRLLVSKLSRLYDLNKKLTARSENDERSEA